jgi:predicted O-methyltransferase YrrM
MSHVTFGLDPVVRDYVVAHGVRESDLLRRLRAETAALPQARMQISPEQGALLRLLVEMLGARFALEVGVFTGYSATVIAESLSPGGRLVACDINAGWTAIARRYWVEAGLDSRVDLRPAPARETLDGLIAEGAAGTVDFAFIDADKESYLDYYERILTLLRPGGVVAVDNVLWSGKVADADARDADTSALKAFNVHVREDARVDVAMIPIGDGLTLARKRT